MASREIIALNETTPQLLAPQTGDNYLAPRKVLVTPEVNTNALAVTGYSLTGTDASSLIDLAGTWNTTGTPTGIKLNITDTASNAASLLLDLQRGGNPQYSFRKDGFFKIFGSTYSANTFLLFDARTTGAISYESNALGRHYLLQGDTTGSGGPAKLGFGSGGTIEWQSTTRQDGGSTDTSLARTAAGIIGIRNGSTGGGALSFVEQTAPSAPAANGCYIYAQDNGAGKTQLMALFASGAAQQLAIEP